MMKVGTKVRNKYGCGKGVITSVLDGGTRYGVKYSNGYRVTAGDEIWEAEVWSCFHTAGSDRCAGRGSIESPRRSNIFYQPVLKPTFSRTGYSVMDSTTEFLLIRELQHTCHFLHWNCSVSDANSSLTMPLGIWNVWSDHKAIGSGLVTTRAAAESKSIFL